jgi:hypothetical protein
MISRVAFATRPSAAAARIAYVYYYASARAETD